MDWPAGRAEPAGDLGANPQETFMNSAKRAATRHLSSDGIRLHRHGLSDVTVAVLALLTALPAVAATKTVDCASTAWASATCWNPDGVPVAGDVVHVLPVGTSTTTLTIASGTNAAAASLDVDSTTGTVAQVNMSGGALTLTGAYMVGVSGSGVGAQSGGALTASSLQIGPYAGSTGSFTFGGASSTMALSQLYVGLRGNGSFIMGNTATVNLSSQLVVGYFDTATNASFTQNSGTINAPSSFIGVDGNASFEQAAGNHVVGGTLYLGYGPGGSGSYTLSSGTLSSNSAYVGRAGGGSFVQNGGTHTVANALVLGQLVGSSGSYTLNGGMLQVGSLQRGQGGASFNWTRGVLDVGTSLAVGPGEVFSSYLSVGDGKELVTPTLTVVGSSTLSVGGGDVAVQTLNNQGRTNLLAGVLDIGSQLNNSGILAMSGGSIAGTGSMTNTGSLTGAGNIVISGPFINTSLWRPEAGTLFLQASGGVTNDGLLELQPGARLQVAAPWSNRGQVQLAGGVLSGGTITNGSTGLISGQGSIAALDNAGLLSVSGGSLSVTGNLTNSGITQLGGTGSQLAGLGLLTNTGTVQGAGNVGMRVANSGTLEAIGGTLSFSALSNTNTATGTLLAGAGGKLLMTQGLATNAGLIQLDGGTYDNGGAAMANTGRIVGQGNLRSSTITNGNQIAFSFGPSDIAAPITNQAGAKLIVSNGAQVTFTSAVTNAGELRVSAGGAANFFALVSGAGSFTGSGQTRFEGGFSPGASPAAVTIDFDVFYGSDSPILMELGGTTPGNCAQCSDKIIFNGLVTLEGGPLNVVWWNDYHGQAGDSFDLFDFNRVGGLTGTFGTVNLPTLDAGLLWQTEDLYGEGVLRVAAVPEPVNGVLMLLGIGMLLARRRRVACRE